MGEHIFNKLLVIDALISVWFFYCARTPAPFKTNKLEMMKGLSGDCWVIDIGVMGSIQYSFGEGIVVVENG
jgi:hypothetical protein